MLIFQDNQRIEDLFDDVMKASNNDYDSCLMLEDLLTDKCSCIKFVGFNFLSTDSFPEFVEIVFI